MRNQAPRHQTYFVVRQMGGRWYVVHLRTGTIVPASPRRAFHETEGAARKAAALS